MGVKAWLRGAEHDLRLLEDLFADGPVRVGKDEQGWFLSSPSLDGLFDDGGAMLAAARTIMIRVNGTATLVHSSFTPVEVSGRFSDSDRGRHLVVGAGSVVLGFAAVATATVNGVQSRRAPGDAVLSKAATHPDAAEVLELLASRPLDWVKIYKIYEIIKTAMGLKNLRRAGWVTLKELNQLTENCNKPELGGPAARHARTTGELGSDPLPIGQAREMIRVITRRWLETLP